MKFLHDKKGGKLKTNQVLHGRRRGGQEKKKVKFEVKHVQLRGRKRKKRKDRPEEKGSFSLFVAGKKGGKKNFRKNAFGLSPGRR